MKHEDIDHTGIPGVGGLGAWTNYTPTWTGTTTNPTLGNGTIEGRYKLLDATTVIVAINLLIGSTTTLGSGGWGFSLPAGMTGAANIIQIIAGHLLDSGTLHYVANGHVDAGDTKITRIIANTGAGAGIVAPAVPFGWTTNDALNLTGVIEIQ